jgi:hypothetical protein
MKQHFSLLEKRAPSRRIDGFQGRRFRHGAIPAQLAQASPISS